MPKIPDKVWKFLRGGAKALVKATVKHTVKKYCESCKTQKTHDVHEDDNGKTHAFCQGCGCHN